MLASSQTPACWRRTKFPKSCFTWRGLAWSSCWFWEKLCPLTKVYHKPRRISRQIRLTLKQRPPRRAIQQTMNHRWQATPRRPVQHGPYTNLLTNSSLCQMLQLGIACDSCWLQAKLSHTGVHQVSKILFQMAQLGLQFVLVLSQAGPCDTGVSQTQTNFPTNRKLRQAEFGWLWNKDRLGERSDKPWTTDDKPRRAPPSNTGFIPIC